MLAGLGLELLPGFLLTTKYEHLAVLDLKRNLLALLPSELFLNLTRLQEVDVSEV